MNKLLKVALGTGLVLSLLGCKTKPPQVVYITKDSVVTQTKTVYKDTIITIPGDTIRFQVPCDKDTVYIVKGKASSSMVTVNKGVVTVQNNCDEKDLIITKLRQELEHYQLSVDDSTKIEIITVNKVPAVVKFFAVGFWILLALLAGLIMFNKNLWVMIAGSVVSIVKLITKKKS